MSKVVVITDLRFPEAQEVTSYLTELGYDVRPVPQDVCLWDEAALSAFAEPFKEDLVGVIHPAPPKIMGGIEEVTEEQWDQAASEGAVAAMIVTKVFCNIMRDHRAGSMIYLNSIHSEKPVGKGFLFSLNCGAVQMLSKEVCQDYGVFDVNVFFVQRGIMEEEAAEGKSDASPIYCGVDLRYPNRRWPEKSHLNGLLAFLLTDAAQPLTGATLPADGGFTGFYNHRQTVEGREYFVWKSKK